MNSESKDSPLVTFALFAYNQEQYIREAVEGAFSQTYSPLEIILSDDCSPDGTFEIMQEMVDVYEGPHKIILNRNEKNLGIGGHVNKIGEIFNGEIIVLGAGDDISHANRSETLVQVYLQNTNVRAVFSDMCGIDSKGDMIKKHRKNRAFDGRVTLLEIAKGFGGIGAGAAYSYHRSCFEWPGSYPAHLMNEDRVLPFHASILGEIVHCPLVLLDYRISSMGVSKSLPPEKILATLKPEHLVYLMETINCALAQKKISQALAFKVENQLKKTINHSTLINQKLHIKNKMISRVLWKIIHIYYFRETMWPILKTKLARLSFKGL